MKMYQQSLMYMLIQIAPLPGKIVNEEAINYGKWATDQSLKIKLDFDEIPPISVVAKRFL